MVTRNDKYLLIVIRNPVPERMIMIILISYVDIANWHKERKFSATGGTYCGYHYVIDLDGTIEIGKPIDPCRLSLQGVECGQHRHLLHRRSRREGRTLRYEDV